MSIDTNTSERTTVGTDSQDTILEVRDVSVSFDMERGESRVLDAVDMDIQRNEILGVVGESGSGKSMFASSLLDAVVEPGMLSGNITYHAPGGSEIDILNLNKKQLKQLRWEEIAMVFQGAMSSFNPTGDIRKHFRETLQAHDEDIEEGMDRARELLADLYLDPERVLDSYPHELSGGMKQRALIALSLVLEPRVLVMDEPTAALDLLMQQSIISLLQEVQQKYDLTIVFITHDLPLVAGLADRLAVMYAFEFVEVGPADRILEEPTHPYARELINTIPSLSQPLGSMTPIEGSSPDPVDVPPGCSYAPRCSLATEECRQQEPPFHRVADDHETACYHWERSVEEINIEAETKSQRDSFVGKQSEDSLLTLDDLKIHFNQGGSIFDMLDVFGLTDDPDPVRAVDGIDLDVYENDVVALVGESGCGKTTLGKAAIGLQRPTEGSVVYRTQDVWDAKDRTGEWNIPYEEIRRSLQIIHQDPGSALNSNQIIRKTLEAPLNRWHPDLSTEDKRARIYAMLEHCGMTPPEDYANRFPHQLSGGEQQRVALIRALLVNPDLILADEAVSALDVSLRVEMMDLMLELQEQFDTSFLFISHDLSNARYLAGSAGGRIGVMYLGEIVEIGPVGDVIEDPKHPYTKALKWSTPDLERQANLGEPPVRGIDIPEATNPPSGCRFHTRCPEAREVCKRESPELMDNHGDSASKDVVATQQAAACFRQDEHHEYWESEPIEDDDEVADATETDGR